MDKATVKKELYKQKPTAKLQFIRSGVAYYIATVEYTHADFVKTVEFEVPVEDMGTADFKSRMEAKLLIRWISN